MVSSGTTKFIDQLVVKINALQVLYLILYKAKLQEIIYTQNKIVLCKSIACDGCKTL